MRARLHHHRPAAVRVLAGVILAGVLALDANSDQPAVLEADDFELDLETGVRTYRGGVVFRQGGVRLHCDELVAYHDADEQLDKGVCTGNPGAFEQRPPGGDADFRGRARSITFDRARGVVVLEHRAEVEHGARRMQGSVITYDLITKKARVESGEAARDGERPRLTIEPRANRRD